MMRDGGDVSWRASQVVDAPRFDWRGVLLDVGRHFFPVPFILKILDICALYKMNRFHWHLTEDQVKKASHSFLIFIQGMTFGNHDPTIHLMV